MSISSLQQKEPVWFDQIDALLGCVSHEQPMPQWLTQGGSMTAYLEKISNAVLEVKLISQLLEPPQVSDALQLGVSPQQALMAREVALFCRGQYCMWAKTFFPLTVSDSVMSLLTLGRRPLGKLIFQDPGTRRSAFEWSMVSDGHSEYHQALKHTETQPDWLFARRSILHWQGQELLLKEVFLM